MAHANCNGNPRWIRLSPGHRGPWVQPYESSPSLQGLIPNISGERQDYEIMAHKVSMSAIVGLEMITDSCANDTEFDHLSKIIIDLHFIFRCFILHLFSFKIF